MKYIRHKKLGFILFEGSVPHVAVADHFGGREEVVSAGFVFSPAGEAKCLGHSGTLNLGASACDTDDLRQRLNAF